MRAGRQEPLSAAELAALVGAGKELPIDRPDAARRDRARSALLLAAQASEQASSAARPSLAHWRRPALAALALAAAATLIVWIAIRGGARDGAVAIESTPPPPPTATRANVQASSSADFVHTATRGADGTNDEVVRVKQGRVTVAVEKLQAGERFRVVTDDAEVEVRGTAFDVDVEGDRLRGVIVHHGLVEVRVAGHPAILLHAGESWRADDRTAATLPPSPLPTPPSPAIEAVAPPLARPPSPARLPIETPEPVPAPAPTVYPSSTEMSFEAGRASLRAGNFGAAADEFARAIAAHPDEPLAEDARYWHGVALARAGRRAAAERAFAAFLDRHPSSLRRGRAALMLGWMLAEDGDRDAARAHFETAATDADDDVEAQAKQALATLDAD